MKRFILKTLLFLLPVFILSASMEYLLRQIPNDYKYKSHYLDKYSKNLKIFILGSSHEYYGINPAYFSQNSFNASHVSQSLDMDFEIFKKYQNEFNNLKVIIIPVDYPALWSKLKDAVDSWRMKNYAIYYGIKTNSLSDHSEILNGKLGKNIQRLYNYYLKNQDEFLCSELGWGTSFKSENSVDLEITGKNMAIAHTFKDIYSKENIKRYKENLNILNSFAEFCNSKNIKLILITSPVYRSYQENINNEQLNKMNETVTDFMKEHSFCHYLNFMDDKDFKSEDFYDGNHLNEIGAKKLTEKLSLFLDSLEVLK